MNFQFDTIKSHVDTLRVREKLKKRVGRLGAAGMRLLCDRSWF